MHRQRKAELEKRIEELEAEEKEINGALEAPETVSDAARLTELCSRLDEVKKELSDYMDEYLLNYMD